MTVNEWKSIKTAYGLLWNFTTSPGINAQLVYLARKLLLDCMSKEEQAEGIEIANKIKAKIK